MGLFDFLFSSSCKICGKSCDGPVCSECDEIIKQSVFVKRRKIHTDFGVVEASSVLDYDNECVQKLLFALKKRADKELFVYAAKLYALAVPKDFCGIVTNVPRRRVNVRYYGYDHVKVPCKFLTAMFEGKVQYKQLLKRRGFSTDQKTLDAEKRKNNVDNKFVIKKKNIASDILLVDDVVTTGNTAKACAEEIMKNNPDAVLHMAFLSSR